MLNLQWRRNTDGDGWWNFIKLNLTTVRDDGIYVVWLSGDPGRVVCLGEGDIAAELKRRRESPAIVRYARVAPMWVTWACVPAPERAGVLRYLRAQFDPLVSDEPAGGMPVAVNLPFAA
jgi:hypothetical protein